MLLLASRVGNEASSLFKILLFLPPVLSFSPKIIEMLFNHFMYAENDDDLSFLPKEPFIDFGTSSLSVSINTEPSVEYVIHPGSVAARIRERKCRTIGGSLKPPVKRKLVQRASTSRSTRAKAAASKDDSSFLTIFDDDEGLPDCLELENANACHLKVLVVDNAVNRRSRELSKVIDQIWTECDVLKDRDNAMDQECEELKAKCEANVAGESEMGWLSGEPFDVGVKGSFLEGVKVKLEAVKASLRQELQNAKLDRAEVVSKVVPYVAMELVNSDDMGKLVAKLVSASILYGQCQAFEEVANMKEPFDITKVKDVVADSHAFVEALLSKKPHVLQRPALIRTHVPASSIPS
ncbi:hypothetical protein Tco_0128332 [Tanacetum coccineum]